MPLISVIIPTRNCGHTIGTAINSIINQTHKELDVIVVDDGSTDDTKSIVESYESVRYIALTEDDPHRYSHNGTNINAGWIARNVGIQHARGEWMTFQDADDASLLNRIEIQYRLAVKHDSKHVCVGWQSFDDSLLGTSLSVDKDDLDRAPMMTGDQLRQLAKRHRGIGTSLPFHHLVPFPIKRRLSLFFRGWNPYPYAGNTPLVHKSLLKQVAFRPCNKRVWPSQRGRGADRDFDFHLAERFGNSLCVNLPLYLWRT